MEPGHAWRRHAWKVSRAALMPHLPLEVLRRRLARARQVGLDYSTYASYRAAGGDDIVAILFSTNALRLLRQTEALPEDRARRLAALQACGRGALAVAPVDPDRVIRLAGPLLDAVAPAPGPFATWPAQREALASALSGTGWPARRVVLVGDTALERGWLAAGRLALYVGADRYFPQE
jgi:hypothetical protein